MPYTVVKLPSLTLTSSATDTSTQSIPAWDVSDAEAVALLVNGTTTAPGLQVQVSLSTVSTGSFTPYFYQSSGASIMYVTSSGPMIISPVPFFWARVGSSNVTSTGYTIVGTKMVII